MADKTPPANPPVPADDTKQPARIPKSLRETGGSDAQKAGEQEQRVNIGNAGKRSHNL